MVVAYDGTDFSGFAAQPNQRARTHRRRCAGGRDRQGVAPRGRAHVLGSYRRRSARVGSGRVVPVDPGLDPWRLGDGGHVDARSRDRRTVVRARRSRRSTRGTRPRGAGTGTRSSTGRCPTRSATGSRGGSPNHSTCARSGLPPTRSSVTTTSRRSAARVPKARPPCAPCSTHLGSTTATVCCATRSAPRRSAGRWCVPIVGTLVEVGTGRRRPGEMLGIIRAHDRAAAGQLAPPRGLCLWEVGF